MKKDTPEIATHLMDNPDQYLLPRGKFIRKSSIDELPNLLNVLKGDMVFVGPRPALHNQYDLIKMRTLEGVHRIKPGITGWAQINGRDDIELKSKVALDKYYLINRSPTTDFVILLQTIVKVFKMKDVSF